MQLIALIASEVSTLDSKTTESWKDIFLSKEHDKSSDIEQKPSSSDTASNEDGGYKMNGNII